jgi:hypothetical protein
VLKLVWIIDVALYYLDEFQVSKGYATFAIFGVKSDFFVINSIYV